MPCGAVLSGRLPETAVGMQDRFAYNGKENVMKRKKELDQNAEPSQPVTAADGKTVKKKKKKSNNNF